jgi:ribosomal-protein-alanine N-acetyltransferase
MGILKVPLQTPRLMLREFREGDADAIQMYAGIPEVTRFTSWGPNTLEVTQAVLAHWLLVQKHSPRIEWPLAIVQREDQSLIGGTGLSAIDWSAKKAEFGYVLQRSAWGQGYATESGQRVSSWAFDDLGLRQLVAYCEPANAASANVLKKVGFEREEGLTSRPRINGEVRSYLTFVKERR